jgi:hypothetical protein
LKPGRLVVVAAAIPANYTVFGMLAQTLS